MRGMRRDPGVAARIDLRCRDGVAYVLMIQRAGLPNSDGTEARVAFERAAAAALTKGDRLHPAALRRGKVGADCS